MRTTTYFLTNLSVFAKENSPLQRGDEFSIVFQKFDCRDSFLNDGFMIPLLNLVEQLECKAQLVGIAVHRGLYKWTGHQRRRESGEKH